MALTERAQHYGFELSCCAFVLYDIIKSLQEPAKILQDTITTNPKKSRENAVTDYDLSKDICIPNLLLKEYSVKIEE